MCPCLFKPVTAEEKRFGLGTEGGDGRGWEERLSVCSGGVASSALFSLHIQHFGLSFGIAWLRVMSYA